NSFLTACQVPTMEIERYGELNKRTASVPFTKPRFYTKLLASPIAMTSIDDLPLIRPNRLPESIRFNVRDQLAIFFFAHRRKHIGNFVELHANRSLGLILLPCRHKERATSQGSESRRPYTPPPKRGKFKPPIRRR